MLPPELSEQIVDLLPSEYRLKMGLIKKERVYPSPLVAAYLQDNPKPNLNLTQVNLQNYESPDLVHTITSITPITTQHHEKYLRITFSRWERMKFRDPPAEGTVESPFQKYEVEYAALFKKFSKGSWELRLQENGNSHWKTVNTYFNGVRHGPEYMLRGRFMKEVGSYYQGYKQGRWIKLDQYEQVSNISMYRMGNIISWHEGNWEYTVSPYEDLAYLLQDSSPLLHYINSPPPQIRGSFVSSEGNYNVFIGRID
ncbi:MAG: hypothetical protein ACYCQJ_15155 [Nitrososphaerales archaeon]